MPLRFSSLFLLTALFGAALLTGCDTAGPEPEQSSPTVDRVDLNVIPFSGRFVQQTAIVRRTGEGDFQVDGRLLLEPGEYRVDLTAFADGERLDEYVVSGPDSPLLRYALEGALPARLTLDGMAPTLVPLDTVLAPLAAGVASTAAAGAQQDGNVQTHTAPLPSPGFLATVADTTGATGRLRLVLQRYESFTAYRRGADPLRIDFDITVPLRVVPAPQE
jgi:hypothetical protein